MRILRAIAFGVLAAAFAGRGEPGPYENVVADVVRSALAADDVGAALAAARQAGVIDGTVRDDVGAPLAGAQVTATCIQPRVSRSTTTAADGRYRFEALPPGLFAIDVVLSGYAPRAFGQRTATDAGTPIRLDAGQRFGADVAVPRVGAIAGTLVDESGEPAAGSVGASGWQRRNGTRVRHSASAEADAEGHYIIRDLPPGEYTVRASGRNATGDIRRMTPSLVARAASAIAHPGEPPPIADLAASPTFTFTPAFYLNAPDEASATPVAVEAGQTRTGIDLALRTSPTTQIDVRVLDPLGNPRQYQTITVVDPQTGRSVRTSSGTNADGRVRIPGITPGTYRLLAQGPGQVTGSRGRPVTGALWGAADVTATLNGPASVTLSLSSGTAVSGRVAFDGNLTPPDPKIVRVEVVARSTITRMMGIGGWLSSSSDASGGFAIPSVPPGEYSLDASISGEKSAWAVAAATLGDRDVLDGGFEVKAGEPIGGLVVTLTDRGPALTGTLLDPIGRPTPGTVVIVFAADRRLWSAPSRRVRVVRSGQDGRFVERGLPAGDYLAALAAYPLASEPPDVGMLSKLAAGATRFTLADGKTTTLALENK